MATIHIITYGCHQKPKKVKWWHRKKCSLTITVAGALPEFPDQTHTTTGLQEHVQRFYEHDLATTLFLADTFAEIIRWIRRRKTHKLYIYVKSETGRIRSVYVGEKIAWLLRTQDMKPHIHHIELLRRKLGQNTP